MLKKKTVRIVKKGKSASRTGKLKANPTDVTKSSLVGTVNNWVTEFQAKRRAETEDALRILSSDVCRENSSARPEEEFENRAALECEMSA